MNKDRERVAALIRTAFAGVTLGDGVGLRQGQGLDAYAGDEELAELRATDENGDWTKIPVADLDYCYSSLSFFDAEGMRFHLPAYLIADLSDALNNANIIFHLTDVSDYSRSQMTMLNDAQRLAIREFLWLRLTEDHEDPDYRGIPSFDEPLIEVALLEYWGLPDDF